MRCPGPAPAPSPSRGRELARLKDGDEACREPSRTAQVSRVGHRAPRYVHARYAEHEGGHRFRRERFDGPFGVAQGPEPVEGLTVPSDVEGLSRTGSTIQS
jgi:hypothetical protein